MEAVISANTSWPRSLKNDVAAVPRCSFRRDLNRRGTCDSTAQLGVMVITAS